MAGECELIVVRRDAGDEVEQANTQNNRADCERRFLTEVVNLDADSGLLVGMRSFRQPF